jgi:hypothetical protein
MTILAPAAATVVGLHAVRPGHEDGRGDDQRTRRRAAAPGLAGVVAAVIVMITGDFLGTTLAAAGPARDGSAICGTP